MRCYGEDSRRWFCCWVRSSFEIRSLAANGNVVLVTINYRLSLWEFLSTEDEHPPGNCGLFDQHLAIQWPLKRSAEVPVE